MTPDRYKPLLDRDFLKSQLDYDYRDYLTDGLDAPLRERLEGWARRELKKETQAEAAFVQRFFIDTWGYRPDGIGADSFQLWPQFPIPGAGHGGNQGKADLGVGDFGNGRVAIPQIVCEFKDIRSGLDAKQNRKGNDRSPVMQAKDYLWGARRGLFGNEPVQPRFAIVTDMDEFRLYWWDGFPDRYLRFKITQGDLFSQASLLGDGEETQFDRFLFQRLLRPDMLLSDAGRTRFERLIEKQGKVAKKLEGEFYAHYRRYREVLIGNILPHRPVGVTRSGAVRLAQKLLDRLIFLMFAEDMGLRVGFPPNALVEQLTSFSRDSLLEPDGEEVWTRLKLIFRRMNTGGQLGEHELHRFNGGLFANDDDLERLILPNRLFVRHNQARNEAKTAEHKETLYFLAATYNFAREGDARNSIGLYTLGHIFEQSIVELEALEAKAEDRPSLTEITKRKRDGVYYTPEWAVERIVEETVDPLFGQWRAAAGWVGDTPPDGQTALAYWDRLRTIRILDPACGSGAFLIVALRHLEAEFARAVAACRETGALAQGIDGDAITDMILTHNLWGVDINPASVEITKLSLWLHTVQPKRPLSGLDRTIQCGNSLIDSSFYAKRDMYEAEARDRIAAFDWTGNFAAGSFDAVIGNPPYVKLQNFVKVNADQAAWLVSEASGYVSTRTGNFDLYLPFIEKGLALLNGGGRMGYIAPSLWPTLDYGEGLRGLIHAGRTLEKWLDFRSYQVFEEATVYTSIQIFSKTPVEAIALSFASDGDISRTDWRDADYSLPYAAIAAPLQPWLLAPAPVKALIERLGRAGTRLDSDENCEAIIVGVQATRNDIYYLQRVGRNRYVRTPPTEKGKPCPLKEHVDIEDAIMRPLFTAEDVQRFVNPSTSERLLFPYELEDGKAKLIQWPTLSERFPLAAAYLATFREKLVSINGAEDWYRYTYPKNLVRQERPKVLVAQLIPNLRLSYDANGSGFLDNVRVIGILPRGGNGWFLLGALNAPITNYVFKWLGKPKANGFFEANKQFIAPLPIPDASAADRAGLSALAQGLQTRRTAQIDDRAALDERLGSCARTTWTLDRILPGVRSLPEIENMMPRSVSPRDRKGWIDDERGGDEEGAIARLNALIRPDSEFAVRRADGKLSFLIDEIEGARVFVGAEGELVEAQWRAVAVGFAITGKDDGKRLSDRLRRVVTEARPEVAAQIIDYGRRLAERDEVLRDDERQLHELTCAMFKLSPAERALVEAGR